ncbi:hypothetical protein MXB_1732 [Myxobolus squamalis]|nr:hypothetical protein MXB_1732 [Myxobolus squamalis]
MRYVAAFVLSKLAGTATPTVEDLKNIIIAADGEFEEKQARVVVEKLSGKDINELIARGNEKMASLAPAASAVSSADVQDTAKAASEEQAKPELEESSEGEDGNLFALFD